MKYTISFHCRGLQMQELQGLGRVEAFPVASVDCIPCPQIRNSPECCPPCPNSGVRRPWWPAPANRAFFKISFVTFQRRDDLFYFWLCSLSSRTIGRKVQSNILSSIRQGGSGCYRDKWCRWRLILPHPGAVDIRKATTIRFTNVEIRKLRTRPV